MRGIRPDDEDFITDERDNSLRLRSNERVAVREVEATRPIVVEAEGVLLVARTEDVDQARKHARHFAAVLAQTGWDEE